MPSQLRVQFGMNVCKQRTLRGIKQCELAAMLDIEPAYMNRIEAGRARPSHELIMGIRAALGCTWDALMEGIPSSLREWKIRRSKRREEGRRQP